MNATPFVCVVLGPDGSGKSSASVELCNLFSETYDNVINIYGSKKEDQYFYITRMSYMFYELLLRCIPLKRSKNFVAQLYLVMVHYNLELVDNVMKTRQFDSEGKDTIIIYDRHPYDRLLPLTTSFFTAQEKNLRSILIALIIAPFMKLNAWLNMILIKKPDLVIFLDVEADILLQRRPDFYGNLEKSKKVSSQYIDLRKLLRKLNLQVLVTSNQDLNIKIKEHICQRKVL